MSRDSRERIPAADGRRNNAVVGSGQSFRSQVEAPTSVRLWLNPNKKHKPETYDDLQLDFAPSVFSSLERYLPPSMLGSCREDKVNFMTEILLKYLPHGERHKVQKHREYRQKIISSYQPMHRELYTMHPEAFFLDSFLKAISDNSEESLKRIISEPSPGVFTFEMLQPRFCELLISEVENFGKWVNEAKIRIMRPNTMNKHGAVLDDFGLETMLEKFVDCFVRPVTKVFFPEVGGSTLDSHHGFVVEYGENRDVELGFHVDDSEITLNVCLGKQFSGGELFFRGTRCDKHVNTKTMPEETFEYSHIPGQAVLHRGRHRHGAKATTYGHRINLLLWCRSSVFREMKKLQRDFSSWCGECLREKKERQQSSVSAIKLELLRKEDESLT